MDCRKARYCLVASFDDPLTEADKKDLSYHLKDCRACRHEAFYYRELFSAEKQLPDRAPHAGFNERLVAEIRLREARSAWPESTTRPERRFRWSLVYVPALFAATAALGFFAFLPGPSPDQIQPVAVETSDQALPRLPEGVYAATEPRYSTSVRKGNRTQRLMFRMPGSANPSFAAHDNPFRSTLVLRTRALQTVRTREQERYVLPVVSQASQRERIY
jgi:anti-sigma factor RsiW